MTTNGRALQTCLCAGIVIVALAMPSRLTGQVFLTVSGGPAEYDLAHSGWSGTGAVQLEYTPDSWWRIEAASGLFWYRTQADGGVVMLLPEIGFAVEAPPPLPIYVGAGFGHSVALRGAQSNSATLYAALGLSIRMLGPWRMRPEVRWRFVDPFAGGIDGFTLGFTRRLGG